MMILIVYNNYWLIYFFLILIEYSWYLSTIDYNIWMAMRPSNSPVFPPVADMEMFAHMVVPQNNCFSSFPKKHIKVVAPISEKQFWGKFWITILKPLVPNITWGSSNFGSSPVFGCTSLRSEVHVATESVADFAVELQNGCAGAVEHGGTWWNLGLGLVTTGIIWVKMFKLSHVLIIIVFI